MKRRLLFLCLLAAAAAPAWAQDAAVPGIARFHQVNEHLYRGGQPAKRSWDGLARLGVKTVVDLRTESEHSTSAETRAVEAAGMRYVHIPLSELSAPPDDKIAKAMALLNDPANGTVFVHCRRGADRTGTVIACYRISQDHWDNSKALAEAMAMGMSRLQTGMQRFIRNYSAAPATLH